MYNSDKSYFIEYNLFNGIEKNIKINFIEKNIKISDKTGIICVYSNNFILFYDKNYNFIIKKEILLNDLEFSKNGYNFYTSYKNTIIMHDLRSNFTKKFYIGDNIIIKLFKESKNKYIGYNF